LLLSSPVLAKTHAGARSHERHGANCVAYAREVTGIHISGNAGMWWNHAEGRYQRGHRPTLGAILVFKPHGRMRSGHVAVVSRIVSAREILVDHANWERGRVTKAMSVTDVSPGNDWSVVKVSGTRDNPVFGFIYPRAVEPQTDTLVAAAPASPHADRDHAKPRVAKAETAELRHAERHAKARLALATFRLDAADRPTHRGRAHEAVARATPKPAALARLTPKPHPPPDLVVDRRREHPQREDAAIFY
jgi:surface antigen